MLTSLAGKTDLRRKRYISEAGFTLVEVMTVLVIIGLMSSVVILTLPKEKPAVESFAENLVRETNAAAQASLLSGRPSALGLSEDRFAILSFSQGEWKTVREQDWPPRIDVKYSNETREVDLPKDLTPFVIFEPIGLSTVFALRLNDGSHTVTLQSQGDGKVLLEYEL